MIHALPAVVQVSVVPGVCTAREIDPRHCKQSQKKPPKSISQKKDRPYRGGGRRELKQVLVAYNGKTLIVQF